MATITTDTFLDGGTARTAGEVWTMNGATLTIRTDTRWHANAPASMTGTLGNLTTSSSEGGAIYITGKNVRWMPYDSGTGNVPAIGTSITQGGVTGYLLGAWANYTSAPTAVGAAMPASGFLKFREVSGGNYSTGALTGIGANATGPDVTGWIEVVNDASSTVNLTPMGNGLKVEGEWFLLGTTNGSRGQTFSVPTNGGGSTTHVIAVQIETAPGSNVYEWWHGTTVAQAWTTANIATDQRGKFFESVGNGVIRIGSDGTNNIGHLPASGCRVRMPNVIQRTVATATRAVNAVPGGVSRTAFTFNGGGKLDLDNIQTEWNLSSSFGTTKFQIKNSALEFLVTFVTPQASVTLDNIAIGGYTNIGATAMLTVSGSLVNFTLTNSSIASPQAASSGLVNLLSSKNMYVDNLTVQVYKYRTTANWHGLHVDRCSNSSFSNIKLRGTNARFSTSSNLQIDDVDYIDNIGGNTVAASALTAIKFEQCANVIFDGLSFGINGVLDNCNPSLMLFLTSNNLGPVKIRNAGTRTAPLSSGTNSALYPQYIFQSQGPDTTLSIQRVYVTNLRTGLCLFGTASVNALYESIHCANATITSNVNLSNTLFRGIGFTSGTQGSTGYPGTHSWDEFTSDTTGKIVFNGNATSSISASQVTLNVTPKQGTGFTGDGALGMDTVGDECIIEMPYFAKGHTSFQNLAPVISGTSTTAYDYFYQLDSGGGYGGTWKVLNAANLSGESISPTGFKLKLRIVVRVALVASRVEFVKISTNSTLAAQAANLYPLDTVSLGFTNLIPGSEVRVYAGTDPATAVEIGGTEATAGSTFSFTHSSSGVDGVIAIFALGYQPIYLPYTFKTTDDSILIQQVIDRNYVNP